MDVLLQPASVAVDRIEDYLAIPNENIENSLNIEECNSIEFCNVSYKYYNTDKMVIDSINFKIQKGDEILIQGAIGSGKSTIVKLILGLYDLTYGEILINKIPIKKINKQCLRNKIPIKKINKQCLRNKIGIVSQDVFLFNGTITDNIRLDNNITISDIEIMIKDFDLGYYIEQFEYGLNTIISKNGQAVSGGQAKIIALLRVLIQKKDIIILDEVTANLDKRTSDKIVEIFKKNCLCNMLIIITHENSWDYIDKKILLNKN